MPDLIPGADPEGCPHVPRHRRSTVWARCDQSSFRATAQRLSVCYNLPMKSSSLLGLLCTLVSGSSLMAQSPRSAGKPPCALSRAGVRILCPSYWSLLEESARETIIGNYIRSPDTPKNVFGGPGKATLSFSTLPAYYKDLAQWIFAGKKIAPESIESKLSVGNRAIMNQTVTRLSSPPGRGSLYASYFFQVGPTPVLLELTYKAEDPKKEEYQSAVLAMIEGAEAAK
jgi:hypothetical protein